MTRYFFDIGINDLVKEDSEGIDLADEQAARREAILTIAEIAAEEIPRDGALSLVIHVRDHQRKALFRTTVSFEPGEPLPS